ncbi:MAG: PhnD/SsuA/transferrin family substrate-binding protein [Cyclobacteriaceae bacterium]|nr:PhnD/SsuA/transferrin family substrate-binding protein [Cyclobacteriaceae bacterium HetDA_MAG_MS6]
MESVPQAVRARACGNREGPGAEQPDRGTRARPKFLIKQDYHDEDRMRLLTSLTFILACLHAIGQDTLRVGIIKYKSEEKVRETFAPLFAYVAGELGVPLQMDIVAEEDLGFHLTNYDYDIGVFTVFPYLRAKEDFKELSVFATHKVDDQEYYHGSILVQKSSGITHLHQLRGKRFLFVKPTSTSGFKYPKGIFTENDLDLDHGFLDYDFTYNHEASLDSLIQGKADGIAINQSYFRSRQDINHDDFVELSTYKVPYHAYVMAPSVTSDLQPRIRRILYDAHKDPRAKGLFQNPLHVTSIIPEDDHYYNLIRRYLRITRVKPGLSLTTRPWGQAETALRDKGDLLDLMTNNMRLRLLSSRRFDQGTDHQQHFMEQVVLNLYQVGPGQFHYQVILNEHLIDEGEDIPLTQLAGYVPRKIKDDVLRNLPIEASLFYNGNDWFVTYGKQDGINMEDYEFIFYPETSKRFVLSGAQVIKLTDLNTHFADDERFEKEAPVLIRYNPIEEIVVSEEDPTALNTYNIFSKAFWQSNYWDKIGILAGVLFAGISALIGRYFQQRKKRKFKSLLYETNELIKSYVHGQYEMETKIIEHREKIGTLLDEGVINENQFLILKTRINDMQHLLEGVAPQEVELSQGQKEEIEEIVKDRKITEKEFLKIMNILKKR